MMDKIIDEDDLQTLTEKCLPEFNQILKQQMIDDDLQLQLKNIYLPLAAWMASKHSDMPLVFGINGAQGSGKSTLSKILQMLLTKCFSKSVIVVSIDDFYLSQLARQELASKVHPLFKTRGVPGTHDVAQAEKTISSLVSGQLPIKIPEFDKAIDDLLAEENWNIIDKPVEIILFEGWCVGAEAQSQDDINTAVNELESQEDPQCIWRNYVNAQLQNDYQRLFEKIDYLLMLKVPDMASVLEWRGLQETKLSEQCAERNESTAQVMTKQQINHFIMHYERLTRAMLEEMPKRADIVMELNEQHQIDLIKGQ
ncbi:MAG: kinase [Sulfuriflexus sp.]|nr:kinase [Sulfuriflexus sp.]